jgi:hypothetical protein
VSILLQGLRIQEYRRPHSAYALVLAGEAGVHIQVSCYPALEKLQKKFSSGCFSKFSFPSFSYSILSYRFFLLRFLDFKALYWCERGMLSEDQREIDQRATSQPDIF